MDDADLRVRNLTYALFVELGRAPTAEEASLAAGSDVRESTKQRSAKVAESILAKRKTEVAMRQHFPARAFDAISFTELADYWWQAHGSRTRSQFEYLYPRVLEYFAGKRARDITPDVVDAFPELPLHLGSELLRPIDVGGVVIDVGVEIADPDLGHF